MKTIVGFLTLHLRLGFGVDLVVDRSARELLKRDFDVAVYTTEVDEQYRNAPYRIVLLDENSGFPKNPFSREFISRFSEFVPCCDPHLWIIHSPPFDRWPMRWQQPVIYWEHGTPPGEFFPAVTGMLLDWTTWYRHHAVYQRRDDGHIVVVAISQAIRCSLPRPLRERTRVIYNGADHHPRATVEQAEALRQQLGFKADDLVAVCVSRFEADVSQQRYKGLPDLIAMWAAWQQLPRFHLVVAGCCSPDIIGCLEKLGITVLPEIDDARLPSLYRAADFCISTSHWEGFNLPLGEALFQGTPSVAFDVGPHRELITTGGAGFLALDLQQFTTAATRLSTDAGLRKRMAANAQESARPFVWQRHGEQLAGLIDSLTASHRTHRSLKSPSERVMPASQVLPKLSFVLYRWAMIRWLLLHGRLSAVFCLLFQLVKRSTRRTR